MESILISACLLGIRCRYDGESKEYDLKNLEKNFNLIPVCPEIYGGLSTPRVPSEIVGDEVFNREGQCVSAQYRKGAEEALKLVEKFAIKYAVLKAKSPSCGKGLIYDGTFSKTLIEGDGVTVRCLKKHGVEVYTEDELDLLFEKVKNFVNKETK